MRGICLHPLSQFHTEEAQCGRPTQAVSPGRWGPSLTRVLCLRLEVWRQTQTEALYCSTGPQNYPLPRDPRVGTNLWLWDLIEERKSSLSQASLPVMKSLRNLLLCQCFQYDSFCFFYDLFTFSISNTFPSNAGWIVELYLPITNREMQKCTSLEPLLKTPCFEVTRERIPAKGNWWAQ